MIVVWVGVVWAEFVLLPLVCLYVVFLHPIVPLSHWSVAMATPPRTFTPGRRRGAKLEPDSEQKISFLSCDVQRPIAGRPGPEKSGERREVS